MDLPLLWHWLWDLLSKTIFSNTRNIKYFCYKTLNWFSKKIKQYIFIQNNTKKCYNTYLSSYLMLVALIDFTFSHVSSKKQTLLVCTHLKWEFKCNWVIRNKIVMTFSLFNQSAKMVSQEQKQKGNIKKIYSEI